MFVPTRRAALIAVVVAAVLVFYRGELAGGLWRTLLLVNAVVLLVVLIDAMLARPIGDLVVTRRCPTRVVVGEAAAWTLQLSTRSGRAARLVLADSMAPSFRAERRRFPVSVDAGATVEVSTTVRPSRRGRFEVRRVDCRSIGPLGVGTRQGSLTVSSNIRVVPAFRGRDKAEAYLRRHRLLEVGLQAARGRGTGTDFESLREATADDELRRVDWAATARAGRVIVRTYRPERDQQVLLLIDNGRVMASKVDEVPRVELATDAAIMVGHVAGRLGDRTGLLAFDATVRTIVPRSNHREQSARIIEAMFALEPELVASDYPGAFRALMAMSGRRSIVIVFTDLTEQSVGDALRRALPSLLRRHSVIVAAVTDPQVDVWATEHPETPEAAYRAAAASSALDDRDRLTVQLRAMGARVVDASPDRLGDAVTEAYLAIKNGSSAVSAGRPNLIR